MKISGVHHVSINVEDVEEAGRFYTQTLGLQPIDRPDFGIPGMWLQCGPSQVHLIGSPGNPPAKGQHFALYIEDLDDTVAELQGKGIEVSKVFEIPDVGRQCFIHDPSGNMIELNQPKA